MPLSSASIRRWINKWAKEIVGIILGGIAVWGGQTWWMLAFVLVPVFVLEAWRGWRTVYRRPAPALERRWWVLPVVFLGVFTVICTLPFTSPQHSLDGYDALPRNWLGTSRLGDWRYPFAPRLTARSDLTVLTLDPLPKPLTTGALAQARVDLMELIQWLHEERSQGVALDFHLKETTGADTLLARKVKDVMVNPDHRLPVVVGYRFDWEPKTGRLFRENNALSVVGRSVDPNGNGCFEMKDHGHLVTFEEHDEYVRSIPLHFGGNPELRSLSYRVAQLTGDAHGDDVIHRPPNDLLYFLPPREPIVHIHRTRLSVRDPPRYALVDEDGRREPLADANVTPHIRDHFVLVGVDSVEDAKRTPFWERKVPGVLIHAWGVEGLRHDHHVRRVPWYWTLLALLFPVLTLAIRFSWRDRWWTLFASTLACELSVLAVALVAMRLDRWWIDTAYVIVGLWSFFVVCSVMRLCSCRDRETAGPTDAPATPPPGAEEAPKPDAESAPAAGAAASVSPDRIARVQKPTQKPAVDGESVRELVEVDRLVRATEARRKFNVDGDGLAAAVLDTGLRTTHEDFTDRVPAWHNLTQESGGDPGDVTDVYGHGTNVSGIVAAGGRHTGVAPGASIVPVKILDDYGDGWFATVRDGLQWVLDHHAEYDISAVCLSMGDGRNHADHKAFGQDAMRSLLESLRAARVAVVVAAGNSYYSHHCEQGMEFPAILGETISVGAVYDGPGGGHSYADGAKTNRSVADRLTPFSQRLHVTQNADSYTHLFAPGAPITATGITSDDAASEQQGTSQAVPVVVGIVLLVQQYVRSVTGQLPEVDALIGYLQAGAVTIHDEDNADDNVDHTGLDWFRVDAVGALQAAHDALEGNGDNDSS